MHTDEKTGTVAAERHAGSWLTGGAVACGVIGSAAAVWAYWLLVPGVVLGVAAIVLGMKLRRTDARDAGTVAVTLGVVALLLVPSVLFVVSDAENWGRNCALNPTNPDC